MQDKPVLVSLIELAPIYAALESPPGGGRWDVVLAKRHEETGRAIFEFAVKKPPNFEILRYIGPTVTGLGDTQLRVERARLEEIRKAAEEAIQAIDASLAMRQPRVRAPEMDAQAWADCIRREPEAITIEFSSGARCVVVVLEHQREVLAREYGGAVFSFGQQVRWPGATVNAWRSRARPDLHAALLAALLEVGFPNVPMVPLYPDERSSYIELRHRNGASSSIMAPGRFFDINAALEKIERELDAICYATQTTPSTHTLPNPEADEG